MIYEMGSWEYKYAHRKVGISRGPAKNYICDCGETAQHWSHIHDTCMDDIDNYDALCVKCHRAYDNASYFGHAGAIGTKNSHAVLTEAKVKEIRQKYSKGGITQKKLAEIYNVQEPAIFKIISYRTWSHI